MLSIISTLLIVFLLQENLSQLLQMDFFLLLCCILLNIVVNFQKQKRVLSVLEHKQTDSLFQVECDVDIG